MGFAEVIKNLPAILQNIKFCKQDILSYQPDVLVLIDYPGFNLRIAEWAKKKGFKIVYYISPQVWAWKESRVKKMKQCIDKMLCILPFEKEYYKNKWNWEVDYVGHPLVQVIEEHQLGVANRESSIVNRELNRDSNSQLIALLPGSRKQEIAKKLPIMLEVAKSFPAILPISPRPDMRDRSKPRSSRARRSIAVTIADSALVRPQPINPASAAMPRSIPLLTKIARARISSRVCTTAALVASRTAPIRSFQAVSDGSSVS